MSHVLEAEAQQTIPASRRVYNRVPQVTPDFWIVKLLAVTVGETAADYIAVNLGLGLAATSAIMSGFLIAALVLQFAQRKYVPWIYWLAVVLISVVGTLITDNLVDNLGYSLESTTIGFSIALALTFGLWYVVEKTLSIHTIYTFRREAFYWLAILFTFALGTAAGDFVAEGLSLGYLSAGIAYSAVIGVIALAYFGFKMNGILAFWLAYIFTRPMGASFGDLLSQSPADGGLGLGTTKTSLIFLALIALVIVYMTKTHDGEEYAREQ
ncbi:hypothetical protein [Roseibium aggregatum]|uniref:Membrane-anchored protein n=1 Tax=Roseibium aggregatum TaxID=187304 RepID=A0A926P636_9HYPH|nr:hypothetical protein [Roseibium aggregatum]MBD1548981.1 hypothetical protein [Roseibium aggregatum]